MVYFTGTRVIIYGHNIRVGIILADGFDDTFAYNMIGQTAKGLCTHNIRRSAVDQLHHLSGQEPALSGLVADGYNRGGHFSQVCDVGRWGKMSALGKLFIGGTSDKLNGFNPQIGCFAEFS